MSTGVAAPTVGDRVFMVAMSVVEAGVLVLTGVVMTGIVITSQVVRVVQLSAERRRTRACEVDGPSAYAGAWAGTPACSVMPSELSR